MFILSQVSRRIHESAIFLWEVTSYCLIFKKNDEKLEKIELDKSVSDTSIDNVDDSLNKLAATIEDSFPSEDEKAQAVDYFSEKI